MFCAGDQPPPAGTSKNSIGPIPEKISEPWRATDSSAAIRVARSLGITYSTALTSFVSIVPAILASGAASQQKVACLGAGGFARARTDLFANFALGVFHARACSHA